MDINKIRTNSLTEQEKMDLLADYLDGKDTGIGLDEVLAGGDTAVGKKIELKRVKDNDDDKTTVNYGTVATSKRLTNGTATTQITAEGSLFIEYQPDNGQLTYLHIKVDGGTPKVMMSDNMKAAFKTELGIE